MTFPVIQRNGFFAHHENVLIAMVNDDDPTVRALGWRRIKKARSSNLKKSVRAFTVPKINFDAKVYHTMIDWNVDYTEPPLTKNITSEELDGYISTRSFPGYEQWSFSKGSIVNIPCHSQAVERHVKLVSDSSKNVVGEFNRDGFMRSTIQSRKKMPMFETKSDFRLNH